MPRRAQELNALQVKSLAKTAGFHFVGGVPGLALQVTNSGAQSWVLRLRIGSKRRDMGLGGYPGVSLADAREAARAAHAKVRDGRDPIDEKRTQRSQIVAAQAIAKTFKECAEDYMRAHEAGWRNSKHAAQWRSTLEQHAYPVLGSMLVRDISVAHVLKVLEPIWTTTTETASRLRGRLEKVLDLAKGKGYRAGDNPAAWKGNLDAHLPRPDKVAKTEHHTALAIDEMGAFMQELRAAEGIGARALEFAILTAARSGEVRGATWGEVDLKAGQWVIPGQRMKAGREHRVALSRSARRLLENLPSHQDAKPDTLLFPAPRGGALSDMTLTAVLRRLGTPAVPHGFRSTFRDWVAERTTYPGDMAEMALAHVVGNKVEAAYRRGDMLDRRRKLMDDWAAFLAKADPIRGTVVPLARSQA